MAEDEIRLLEAMRGAGVVRGPGARVVVDLIGARKADNFLTVELLVARGNHLGIGHDVIHIVRSQGTGKAQVVDLQERGSVREDTHAQSSEIAVEIDQYVDLFSR